MKSDKQKIWQVLGYLIIIILLIFITVDGSRIVYYQVKLNEYSKDGVNIYQNNSLELRKYVNTKMNGIDIKTTKEKRFTEYQFVYHVKLKTPIINVIIKDGYKITSKEVIEAN